MRNLQLCVKRQLVPKETCKAIVQHEHVLRCITHARACIKSHSFGGSDNAMQGVNQEAEFPPVVGE